MSDGGAGGRLRTARTLLWGTRWAVLLAAGLAIYGRRADSFDRFIVSSALVLSLLALCVDLQWGYAGILNLGPAAYLGLGAYAYAITQRDLTAVAPTYPAFALALVLGAGLALIVAYPAFRARTIPVYYALITLAVSLILQRWASVSYDFAGGSNGLIVINLPDFSLPGLTYRLASPDDFYPLVAVIVLACYLLCVALTSSSFGRVLRAIRQDEEKVATLGYDVAAHKLLVVAVAGAIGGLAGALYAPLSGTAHPSLFALTFSIQAYVWVAVGGQGTLIGPILAALALKMLENRLRGVSSDNYLMILAAAFMLSVIFLPRGIAGLLVTLWRVPRHPTAGRLRPAPPPMLGEGTTEDLRG